MIRPQYLPIRPDRFDSVVLRNMSVLSYANGFTLWHYRNNLKHDIFQKGYFDEVKDLVTPGDMIYSTNELGATIVHVGCHNVISVLCATQGVGSCPKITGLES